MKSLLNRIHRLSGPVASISRVHPARDEGINLLRKFVTEFIDIGGHVVIIGSWLGGGGLQALGLFQGFREGLGRAGCGFGGDRALRPTLWPRPRAFEGGKPS